jgi:hypothetical protein
MQEILKRWWQGTYVPAKNDPNSGLFFMGNYKLHWTATVAHALVAFWLRHWQYSISTAIAVVGLFIALKKL